VKDGDWIIVAILIFAWLKSREPAEVLIPTVSAKTGR